MQPASIFMYLVTTNPGMESKPLNPLLKNIGKHNACFVVCATFQIYYGSVLAINASMDDESP